MKMRIMGRVMAVCAFGFGCGGGDDNGESGEGTVNTTIASSTTEDVASIASGLTTGMTGETAAFGLAGAGASLYAIVTPTSGGAQASGERRGQSTGCVSGTANCSATSCTFDQCGDGTWSIDGTLSWDGGHIVCDLTIAGTYGGFSYSMDESCDLTVTENSLDGTLAVNATYTGSGSGYDYNVDYSVDATFDQITWNDAYCLTGGTLSVDASYDGTANGSNFSLSGSGSVTFDGTGC